MSKVCQITGRRVQRGNNVSHSKRRTRRTFEPNLRMKRFYLAEEKRWVRLKISAAGIREIEKNGLQATLRKAQKAGLLKKY
ncbi:MAG: 50S ribosomal protein L28 [Bacteroides sp.]